MTRQTAHSLVGPLPQRYLAMLAVLLLLLAAGTLPAAAADNDDESGQPGGKFGKPNIVYIMSDELAYFETSHMGNPYIKTPRIDRMAAEGLRFTEALAGAPVCAPLRCSLMTGKHQGHASVRANDGGTPLRAEEATIASILKPLGYATGGFGKWGAGGRGSTGVPEKHGFDVFFGYYDQVHAHSFYPPYLVRNSKEVVLPGNKGGRSGKTYSHYEIMKAGLQFIRDNKDKPFFCYLPITPPHGMYDIPSDDPAWRHYKNAKWMEGLSQDIKNYAAMVSMVDDNVGQVLDLLKELGLEDNTIVFFTGDNGGQDRFRSKEHPRGFYGPNVNPKTGVAYRGGKGNLYEGGLRITTLVRWPKRIQAGRTTDLITYQPDVLPTIAELTGAKLPKDVDGISILPTLLGEKAVGQKQANRAFLYWESGQQTAVRMGKWKGIQPSKNKPWELYDLSKDISEANSIAEKHPDIVAKVKAFAEQSHTPVQPGTFEDRTAHNRDRWAKWGDAKAAPPSRKAPTGKKLKLPSAGWLDKQAWKLVEVSSENKSNHKLAANAIDGDSRTLWHSQFSPALKKHPHHLIIDLGKTRTIKGFYYLARQDNGWNGTVKDIAFYVSDSADALKKAADGAAKPAVKSTLTKTRAIQKLTCKPVKGRYVLVRALSEVNGSPWASAAELGVMGE